MRGLVLAVLFTACGGGGGGGSAASDAQLIDAPVIDGVTIDGPPLDAFPFPDPVAQAYIKASNPAVEYGFGGNISNRMRDMIALSNDGSTLAVASMEERSSGTGVNGDQADSGLVRAGAVYVFVRSGSTWSQQAYIKASDTSQDSYFGNAVALSSDGNTLAVGAVGRGAVYMFTRTGTTWSQQAIVTSMNYETGDVFGFTVSLSADGMLLAVGAIGEDSGLATNAADNSAPGSGAAYVFASSGSTWTQQAYLKASNVEASDSFGFAVALSGDASWLAVGAVGEASASTNPADNSATNAGAVYVFGRSGSTWTQQAYVKASNPDPDDAYGSTLALSADGATLAVTSDWEASAATGIDGNQQDDSTLGAGAVYILTRSGAQWTQQAYVKASNTGSSDWFGRGVAISSDGNRLAVSAYADDSGSPTDQTSGSLPASGAVYLFARTGTTWAQTHYVKASTIGGFDFFGDNIALSADASTLAVGAPGEDSSASGINGNQLDNSLSNSGACYVIAL